MNLKKLSSKIIIAILFSFLINVPFVIGELLNRNPLDPRSFFPVSLFIGLWLHMALFAYVLMTVINSFRNATVTRNNVLLGVQLLILVFLAWAWTMLIIDQWPCFFLGGNGC